MARTNIMTQVVLELQQEIAEFRRDAEAVTPFMHEKVKPSVTLKRSDRMTRAQREEVAQSLGQEGVLKMIRGGKDAN